MVYGTREYNLSRNRNQNNRETTDFEYLFRPRSIAIVGVSNTSPGIEQVYLKSLLNYGYRGKIFLVGTSEGEKNGYRIYKGIESVPDSIDYVIAAIPAEQVISLVSGCAAKGAKAIHVFSSGFSEMGTQEGKVLESRLVHAAQEMGLRIIGPNSMGLYYPKVGLSFVPGAVQSTHNEHKLAALVCQSGANCSYAIGEGAARGVSFGKVISHGNASDLNEADFVEYLTVDPETKIITLYIEGFKEGRRFMKAVKKAARVKPTIIYRGGNTENGIRAIESHTGSLATARGRIWNNLLHQIRAVFADSMDELIDMTLLFSHLPKPKGNRVGIIGMGGGAGVRAADICSSVGLIAPELPAETQRQLKSLFGTEVGGSYKNPLDLLFNKVYEKGLFEEAIKIAHDCDLIDLLFLRVNYGFVDDAELQRNKWWVESITNFNATLSKPVIVVLRSFTSFHSKKAAIEAHDKLVAAGYPVFFSMARSAIAAGKFVRYHQTIS